MYNCCWGASRWGTCTYKKIGGDLMEDMQFLASIIFVQLFLDKEVLLKNKVPPLESA